MFSAHLKNGYERESRERKVTPTAHMSTATVWVKLFINTCQKRLNNRLLVFLTLPTNKCSPLEDGSLECQLLQHADEAEHCKQRTPASNIFFTFGRESRQTLRWPGQLQEGGAVLAGRDEQEPLEGRVEEW